MHCGQRTLLLHDRQKMPVTYQFGSVYDDSRAGYLLCDTAKLDPLALHNRLQLICEDGSNIVVAVMHSSDRYLAVIGRVEHASGRTGPAVADDGGTQRHR